MYSIDVLINFNEIFISSILLFIIVISFYKYIEIDTFTKNNKFLFINFAAIKLCITVFTTFYIFDYSSDGKLYRKTSQRLLNLIYNDPPSFTNSFFKVSDHLDNSLIFFTHIISLEYFFLFNSYIATNILISSITIFCAWRLFKVFKNQFSDHSNLCFYPILFTPAFLFWTSSSHLKEAYMYSCLVLIIYAIYTFPYRFKILKVATIILCGYFIFVTRSFLFIILLVSILGTLYIIQFNNFNKIRYKVPIIFSSLLLILFVAIAFNSDTVDKFFINASHRKTHSTMITKKTNGALIKSNHKIKNNTTEILYFPMHVITASFRPWLWESGNSKTNIIKIESFIILVTFLYLLFSLIKFEFKNIKINPLITFSILFSLGLLFTIGLSSANYGAISRYRSITVPFLLTALWTIIQSIYNSKNPSLE